MTDINISKLFGQILKEVRQNRMLSQEELAEASDLDRTYISMLERGLKNPTIHTLFQLSRSLRVPAELLINFIENPPSKSFKKSISSTIEMPLYGTAVSCGKPVGNDHLLEKMLSLENLVIKNPKETFFVKAIGESMSPTIQDGDYLVVDKSSTPKHGQIILAQLESDFTVKRYTRQNRIVTLTCDNPLYKDIEIDKTSGFTLCGVVTSVLRLNP
ncbi:MAG: LexA family protein [Bacteriovoracaceae bacterium]